MRWCTAILLAVAFVPAISTSSYYYGWIPNKESLFHYEAQVLTGIPEIRQDQYSGLKLVSKVRVQSYADFTLRVQFQEPKFITVNGIVDMDETGRLIEEGGRESSSQTPPIPDTYRQPLEEPFLVHLKRGVVESFFVSQHEPTVVTNIKRALLAQLQLDVSASLRSQIEDSHIQLPLEGDESVIKGQISYFTTSEESVHGECLTTYTLHPLPEYRAKELEEAWQNEDIHKHEAYHPSIGQEVCAGKQYYQITKTRDFDQCKVRPVFQKLVGVQGTCDSSKSECHDLKNGLSSSTYFVCGELSEFNIRKVVANNDIVLKLAGYTTKEELISKSRVMVELLKQTPILQRLSIPSSTKEEKTLIYSFQDEQEQGPSEAKIKETEELIGQRPVLPQPGLTEAPKSLISIVVPKEKIISQVVEHFSEMVKAVFESPESCGWKEDVAGYFSIIARYLSRLDLPALEELERRIMEGGEHRDTVKSFFYNIVSVVGTNPSTMFILKKVKTDELTPISKALVLQSTIRSVKYPTEELMQQLVKLVKEEGQMRQMSVMIPTVIQLSNLFYHAYVNPSTMVSMFPVKVYGVFGTKESHVLKEEYIPYLIEQLEDTHNEELRLVLVTALGKLGHWRALKPLLGVAIDKLNDPMARAIAISSMKRMARINPSELKPILLSIVNNPSELPEVRIAAVSILPFAQPTTAELQKVLVRSWFEPSKQVASFIYSTLVSLIETEVPELKALGKKVKPLISLIKPTQNGIQFSQNVHSSKLVEYLKAIASHEVSVTNSKNGLIPTKLSVSRNFYGPDNSWIVHGLSFSVYTQGMEKLLDEYLSYLGTTTKASQTVIEQLQKIDEELKMNKRVGHSPKTFIQASFMGYESGMMVNAKVLAEALTRATVELQNEVNGGFSYLHAMQLIDVQLLTASEVGFPICTEYSVPLVYTVRGYLTQESSETYGEWPKIKAKLIPVVNIKNQASFGVVSPFSEELLGSGYEMSLHTSLPFEAEAKVTKGELELNVKTPSDLQESTHGTENLHAYIIPYTFKMSLCSIKPISKSTSIKHIESGWPLKKTDIPFGETIGFKGRLWAETDAEFTDFYSYYELLSQNSLLSLFSLAGWPSSLRKSSTKVMLYPTESETKEFNIVLKLYYKDPVTEHELSYDPHRRSHMAYWRRIEEPELERKQMYTIKKVLDELQQEAATMVHVRVAGKGRYQDKAVSAGVLLGSKVEGHTVKHFIAADIKTPVEGAYGFEYEGVLQMPKVNNRWSVKKLLQENLKSKYIATMKYGLMRQEQSKIRLEADLSQTESQKNSVRGSPEYKRCLQEEREGRMLAPVCIETRHQAASLDQIELTVSLPKEVTQNPVTKLLAHLTEAYFMFQMTDLQPYSPYAETTYGEMTDFKVKTTFSRVGDAAQAEVEYPGVHYKIHNIRLFEWVKGILPISVRNYLPHRILQKVTSDQAPASCRIEPHTISTFDNKTYQYDINDCSHLLLMDGTKQLPLAVLTRTVGGGKKVVKILAGYFVIVLGPNTSGQMLVKINDKSIPLQPGQILRERSSDSEDAEVELKRYQDDVYCVYLPKQSLEVLTDGVRLEVVAPQLLRNSTVGLCGDLNGENTADLKSPHECVMKTKYAAMSYILNKAGSESPVYGVKCQGIPSEDRIEYEQESKECIKEYYVPTPLRQMYELTPSLNKPVTDYHIVNKQRNQVCISKQKVNVCALESHNQMGILPKSVPTKLKPKVVEFVCIRHPSTTAESLVNRARAGESLYTELQHRPTVYRKIEYEPTACKPTQTAWAEHQEWQQPSRYPHKDPWYNYLHARGL